MCSVFGVCLCVVLGRTVEDALANANEKVCANNDFSLLPGRPMRTNGRMDGDTMVTEGAPTCIRTTRSGSSMPAVAGSTADGIRRKNKRRLTSSTSSC